MVDGDLDVAIVEVNSGLPQTFAELPSNVSPGGGGARIDVRQCASGQRSDQEVTTFT